MELYVLDSNFQAIDVIDDFFSVIWTERFSKSGDLLLNLEATSKNLAKVPNGTRLSISDSKEIMTADTTNVEDGVLKITGNTLERFFSNRFIYLSAYNVPRSYPITGKPAFVMGQIVTYFIITDSGFAGYGGAGELHQTIPNLTLGSIDTSGVSSEIGVPFGQVDTILDQLAETYQLGHSLYLDSVSAPTTYSLKYKVWSGRDLTSDQSVYPAVRFSQDMDTLTDPKMLTSNANYKNVAVVYIPGLGDVSNVLGDGTLIYIPHVVTVDGGGAATGFNKRILLVEVTDLNSSIASYPSDASQKTLQNTLIQRGKDALANNNYTKVIDGEVVPQNQYKYGTDYLLGDIVELDAFSGAQNARITEYIRSQDSTGEKAYPTVSVI